MCLSDIYGLMIVSKNFGSLYSGEPTIEITGRAGLSFLCIFISPYNLPGVDPVGRRRRIISFPYGFRYF